MCDSHLMPEMPVGKSSFPGCQGFAPFYPAYWSVAGGIGLAACGLALCTEAGVVLLGGAAVAGGVYYYYRRTHQTNG